MPDSNNKDIMSATYGAISATSSLNKMSSFQTPQHTHNGSDSPKVDGNNIIPSSKYYFPAIIRVTGTYKVQAGGTIPTGMSFSGYAQSASGFSIINGISYLGNNFRNLSSNISVPQGTAMRIIQSSTFLSFNNALLTSNVGITQAFIAAKDVSDSPVVDIEVTDFDNQSVTLTATLTAGWIVTGNFIIF